VGPCSSQEANFFYVDHAAADIEPMPFRPIEIFQCERIGAPDANISYAPIPSL
jgi:hypothetical protein